MNVLQKQIQTTKATIFVIGGLPEDVHNFRMHKEDLHYDCLFAPDPFNLPLGKWQPLGFLKDITEDVAKELVDEHSVYYDGIGHRKYYENYIDKHPSYDRATESLHSLIETNCKLKNKYGETMPELEPTCCNKYVTDRNGYPECCGAPVPSEQSIYLCQLWQEEQSQVFTNPFLLKKV